MASLTTQADAIRSAITSVQTCTPTISATLKELLQGVDSEVAEPKTAKGRTKAAPPTKGKPATAAKKSGRATKQDDERNNDALPPKEKALLATQVINATLKALGEAAKSSPTSAANARTAAPAQPTKAEPRKGLRRSSSMPMTPLQPRTLNRVSTSPTAAKSCRPQTATPTSSGCLAMVECTRAAFATLRTLSTSGNITFPELQIETGMSSFVNRLIALSLFEYAVKELRLLKRRLEGVISRGNVKKTKGPVASEATTAAKTLADLFDYPLFDASAPVAQLVVTSQLQALRILYGLKKSSYLDTALPFLRPTHQSSPLVLLIPGPSDTPQNRLKSARQLESLAQSLLSLTPSVSANDDGVALEPRLSPSPETSLEIQSIALKARLHSWGLSGHKGDLDKELLSPLSRCLSAFNRRSTGEASSKFAAANSAFEQVWQMFESMGLRTSDSSRLLMAAIYQSLGSLSREAGGVKDAIKWITKLRDLTSSKDDSAARCHAVTAQLLALCLKQSSKVDESMINEVLDGLQGSLSGSTTELDDLLISICQVRKATVGIVLGAGRSNAKPSPIRSLLETLLLQLPRFTLRWLGKPPASGGPTKDFLRFEQRRQLLSKYIHHVLDSVLMLVKALLEEENMAWDLMDSVFQDCLAVLENMGDLSVLTSSPSASYHVKISHFYYQQHILLRKKASNPKDSLRALRRSIDAVKQQPESEQTKAQLLAKQERLAELCRSSGRKDDAADALRSIRDSIVREDIVSQITAALASTPALTAWQLSGKTESLSRTVCTLAKLDPMPCDWTWLLTGSDKTTALEHDLYFIYSTDAKLRKSLEAGEPLVEKLLQSYPSDGFPIRRLRTLAQLLTVNIESRDSIRSWVEEAKALSKSLEIGKLGEDAGLARYIPHLQSLTVCLVALFELEVDWQPVQEAVSFWVSTLTNTQSLEDLYGHIDNPAQLLTNLQSLSDYARMRGMDSLLESTLELTSTVSKLLSQDDPACLVAQNTALCLQYLTVGHSTKAETVLTTSQLLLSCPDVPHEIAANFHLCSAEYQMAIGNYEKAERHLADAHVSGVASMSDKSPRSSRATRKLSIAYASFLQAMLVLERGNPDEALRFAKNAVRILYHDWAKLETMKISAGNQGDEPSQVEASEDDCSFNSSVSSASDVVRARTGPEFWAMVYPLFRFVLRLSSVYAHIGMFQETMYYGEQALKIARSTNSTNYIMQSQAWLAVIHMKAGAAEKALELALEIKESLAKLEPNFSAIRLACQLSQIYRDTGDYAAESELLNQAESMIAKLDKQEASGGMDLDKRMSKLTIKDKATPKATRLPRSRVTKAVSKAAPRRKATTAAAKFLTEKKPLPAIEDKQLMFMRAFILQQRSAALLREKEWSAAVEALQTAGELPRLSADMTQDSLFMAVALIGQSLELMGKDSVYSAVLDSTLSFPTVAGSARDKALAEKNQSTKASPPRKGRAASQEGPPFLETLRQARDHLLDAHAVAVMNGDGVLVQRVATLLQNTFILLSTTNHSKVSGASHPAYATCSVEMARNLVWRRERKTLKLDSDKGAKLAWPMPVEASDSRRSSLSLTVDMNKFQKEYIDIIPSSWNVVSVSLSDNKHDLCITKLQAGHSPFAIRLPLERAMSRDADNEVFNFQQGRAELLDIIDVANRTCHDARDMSAKGAKSAWWSERESLDERMKKMLDNIEHTWLGGFRGIFSQHHRRSDLLARFQKSFQNILDNNLPSRRQVRGRRTKAPTAPKVSLDPRILDLFIGLGDATMPDCDFDEPLTDLLYFVVDILQFHGERNAYDEIDLDRMVVEITDALHSYHTEAKSSRESQEQTHTILVLDKSLHIVPWESLPCMQGVAVSRVPSLACLRRSILEQQASPQSGASTSESTEQEAEEPREGHHISRKSGTYILNPGADLKNTQSVFGQPLSGLPLSWSAIEARIPTESEFESALTKSDLLLYFGHGSGAQYIRGRTIRKMEKCRAVALLMGCSSASLTAPGDFEPHGPVWNYMLAGSPAVVGTLWDVTDRDIDRYAGRLFEEWGLFARGTFAEEDNDKKSRSQKGKKKTKAATSSSDRGDDEGTASGPASLVEAVARARDACKFRYLTAAAVCVYGIPVYVGK
ncbi:peptidase family C50 [Apiospora rasikravindrae]|uniref:separase n=1 Tax=Apiospora rasikravindrae TaxID=990691 RepID=A0ABR1UAD0_9PEZI